MSRLIPKSIRINAGETLLNISLALAALILTVGLEGKKVQFTKQYLDQKQRFLHSLDQKIVRLDVTMNDVSCVKFLDDGQQFDSEEGGQDLSHRLPKHGSLQKSRF